MIGCLGRAIPFHKEAPQADRQDLRKVRGESLGFVWSAPLCNGRE
jgi:hypothetical protein